MSEAPAGYNQETLRQVSDQSIPEALSDCYDRGTSTSQIKEEVIAKKDIVVKKKDNQKKIVKKKSNIRTKKTSARPVNQIVKNQTEDENSSGNSGNFQSPNLLLSSTNAGSLYGGVSFDAQDFQYPYYRDQIIRKIRKQWRWIKSYGKLRSLVYFRIRRDGTVCDISIRESSGNSEYDRNALDTVCRVTSFPELPEGYNDESLGVFFEFKMIK
jgi:TonB family protein